MTTIQPLFQDLCVNWDTLLAQPSLKTMLKTAEQQSKTSDAMLKTNPLKFDPQSIEQDCPLYFGMAVEWIVYHFLRQYGRRWNISEPRMITNTLNSEKDVGIDCEATTPTGGLDRKVKGQRTAIGGAPVFIQIKGSLNPTKVYKPNDGSRLGNFFAAAQHKAKKQHVAYKARYVVIHTGRELNSWFANFADYEEINCKDMATLIDGDYGFLNTMRAAAGLEPLTHPVCEPDNPNHDN
jgi:hypothetical protein